MCWREHTAGTEVKPGRKGWAGKGLAGKGLAGKGLGGKGLGGEGLARAEG
jgi:hypothetical protein